MRFCRCFFHHRADWGVTGRKRVQHRPTRPGSLHPDRLRRHQTTTPIVVKVADGGFSLADAAVGAVAGGGAVIATTGLVVLVRLRREEASTRKENNDDPSGVGEERPDRRAGRPHMRRSESRTCRSRGWTGGSVRCVCRSSR